MPESVGANKVIYFLVDATWESGLGHFMRSMSLARALADQGRGSHFIGSFLPTARQLANQIDICLTQFVGSLVQRARIPSTGSQIIVDSYRCQPDELPPEQQYLLTDDFCDFQSYPVTGVINFTVDAHQYDYIARGAGAQALGTGYFLPHPLISPPSKSSSTTPRKVLVMIGSGDRHGLVPRILKALSALSSLDIRVIGSYPNSERSTFPEVEFIAPTPDIGMHYEWADFCITSGGLAKYECAWLGKPAAVISQTPGEQAETLQFQRHGLCFNLGYCTEVTSAGLAEKLANILSDRHSRQQAHESCRQHFSSDSPRAAAEFVLDCLAR